MRSPKREPKCIAGGAEAISVISSTTDLHRRICVIASTDSRFGSFRHKTLRILITNDDGIDSPGIEALVHVLVRDHDIVVVAPSGDRSGVSHAIRPA